MNPSGQGIWRAAVYAIGMMGLVFLLAQTPARAQPAVPPSNPAGEPGAGPRFDPPPVPDFMLRKPAAPLSMEEMQRQADEAAARARPGGNPSPDPKTAPAR